MMAKCVICLLIIFVVVGNVYPYPWHASCKVTYQFNDINCQSVQTSLIRQFALWNNTNCGSGKSIHQRCRYALKSQSSNLITATHTTPLKLYIDDMMFKFSDADDKCTIKAFSTSTVWYAVLDFGTNYCNIHNIIFGSGLTNFTESTSNSICTQFSTANCDRY